ncbi:Ldh family oxidoreductase [Oceanicella actignis]|uniref:(2R)-3-sulfolactate dehydrogenase (NADP+) n=1 Tax=Oceanicella actignis TaxID=1189325 RepID=A0A1M7SBX4_9RHOB|nr:Ldh family oxidoreductase [Oceanicella actignis]SET26725.1 (2R)-3-sulfolactate dehydrogenase (NADP+) [Oceanicella actignis]SHN55968.1 (2R)-3-sulfolactate dehydrogenase (NADP+) [Oceanicella actignis]
MNDHVTLSLDEARRLTEAAMTAAGALPEVARSVAAALVAAEASGHAGHGLSRVPSYVAQCRAGKADGRARPTLEQPAPAALRVDAAHGFAYPAFDLLIPALAELAGRTGIALGAVRRSNHFGVAGAHCEALAELGRVALIFGNAPAAMAPWGGARPALGTNPIAFAAPMPDGPPLVVDMATSTVPRGKILAARELGAPIPEGWALGPDGRPTTDPETALKGTVAPMAGPKGAALALMVEVLSACLGGGALGVHASSLFDGEGPPPDLAQTLIAIDPELIAPGFAERMAALAAALAGIEGARLPGQRRLQARARAQAEGLRVPRKLNERLRALAAGD